MKADSMKAIEKDPLKCNCEHEICFECGYCIRRARAILKRKKVKR